MILQERPFYSTDTVSYTHLYFLESNGKKRPAEGSISKDLVPDSENGKWYYFQSNGKARKGENGVPKEAAIDGRKYYFDENGVMPVSYTHLMEAAAGRTEQ